MGCKSKLHWLLTIGSFVGLMIGAVKRDNLLIGFMAPILIICGIIACIRGCMLRDGCWYKIRGIRTVTGQATIEHMQNLSNDHVREAVRNYMKAFGYSFNKVLEEWGIDRDDYEMLTHKPLGSEVEYGKTSFGMQGVSFNDMLKITGLDRNGKKVGPGIDPRAVVANPKLLNQA